MPLHKLNTQYWVLVCWMMLCPLEMNLDKTRVEKEKKRNYLFFLLTKEMVKLYKCVISSIDISLTCNNETLGIMPLHKMNTQYWVLVCWPMICPIETILDKTRVEKEKKKNYLFIYRHLNDVQHCYTWHNATSQNEHTILSVGLLNDALSIRDEPW